MHCLGGTQFLDHGLDGQGHVRPGVAVRYRVHIEAVQRLLMVTECVTKPSHDPADVGCVELFECRHAAAS